MTRLLIAVLLLLVPLSLTAAEPAAEAASPFFAMNTGARGGPEVVAPLLEGLGYAGLGGGPAGAAEMATALEKRGMKLFNVYVTTNFDAATPALDDRMRKVVDDLKGHDSAIWLAVGKVSADGKTFAHSSADGDKVALAKLGELADYAEPRGVKIALYPHTGMWLARVEDGVRVADKLNRPGVGATFNLCHWLKVEGDVDPAPTLKAAMPRLMFVSINGADGGDTKTLGWKQLIQTLDRGSYDVGKLLATLRKLGYTGPIGLQAYGIGGDQRENLTRSMAAWKRISASN
ncbi:MAG: sugar phosphate isomerase/epimerase [Candidatus Nealsonbacteria bacterium]|nr:sugar phosphate isomerase/epimerase [Candidatus Nealsonbacteria bacterium]